MTINQRLIEYYETKNISAPEFYKKFGGNRNEWSGWSNSGKPITVAKIQRILAEFPDINARWFLTGEGQMLNQIEPDKNKYAENNKMRVIEEPSYVCSNCAALQAEIKKLNSDLIDAKNETIAALSGQRLNTKVN